jgi:hypothetical protein
MRRTLPCCFGLAAAALMLLVASQASACACCSHDGWRYVETEPLSARRTADIEQMRFAGAAKLMTGEADPFIKGVADASESYKVAVRRQKDRMVFAFRDDKGRDGTLTLVMPKTISIFEVDPRGAEKDKRNGPTLYKEWKLTANAAGDGLFRAIVHPGQKLTLILHGQGNSCTSPDQFTDWTLLVHGPTQGITLIGELESAAK